MDIAIIKNSICMDTAVFDDLKSARQFLGNNVWPEADTVTELPTGYGIGDSFDGETWRTVARPAAEPEVNLKTNLEADTLEGRIADVESGLLELAALLAGGAV